MRIYLIRNRITGLPYIGLTAKTAQARFAEHVEFARSGSQARFHKAIREFGSDVWDLETLTYPANRAEAKELEKAFIAYFNSYDPAHGYNSTPGGDGVGHDPKSIDHRKKIGEGVRKYREPRQCPGCDRYFIPTYAEQKVCNMKCRVLAAKRRRPWRVCEICGKDFQQRHSPAKGPATCCSHTCRNVRLGRQGVQAGKKSGEVRRAAHQ